MTPRPAFLWPRLKAADLLLPWAAFLPMLAWSWRVGDLFGHVPGYGDGLEVLWGLDWYAQSLIHGRNPLFDPAVFAPQGWQVATLAHGPILFLALMPLYALGGAAFAYNAAALGAHVLAFAGMYKATRLWLGRLAGIVAALAFTFWGYRWFRNSGHLHTLLASALLPLEVWAWEQARRHPGRRTKWYLITGVIWAAAITASLYALWHMLVLLLTWCLAELWAGEMRWKALAQGCLISGAAALALSSPTLWLFWRGMSAGQAAFNDIQTLVAWSSSLNSFWVPGFGQPWLGSLARQLDPGPPNESEIANFGLLGFTCGLLGLVAARKDKRLRPLLACSLVGLLLAMGPAVKISGSVVNGYIFGPVVQAVWSLGRQFKPALFTIAQPSSGLAQAIPLPDLVAAALVPFWEGARVTSRFAFVAGVGLFPLMGLTVQKLPLAWMRAGLALALVLEVLPAPTGSVPARPAAHPAFVWLASQNLAGQNIVDLAASQPDRLALLAGGDIVFSTLYHHQQTVSGVGSYMPAQYLVLQHWFHQTSHPLLNSDFAAVMRSYHVRLVVVHMESGLEQPLVDDAQTNPELRLVQCFDPPSGISPWAYRVCILHVAPPANAHFNLVRRDGWSAPEPWGTWVGGNQATAAWFAPASAAQQISLSLLPVCLPGRPQHVTLQVNGAGVADHAWDNCDAWTTQISLPAGLVRAGWNVLAIQADVAGQPVDPASGKLVDTRRLSVAATQLFVGPP